MSGDQIILSILAIMGLIQIGKVVATILSLDFFKRMRIKIIFFLIGNDTVVSNCSFLSGHIVQRGKYALFSNNIFNEDVFLNGKKVRETLNLKSSQ